jgi:hypothetical protein
VTNSRPYRFVALRNALVVATLAMFIYVATFWAMRKTCSVTFLPGGRIYSVRVQHFANEATVNRLLYMLYWPLHRQKAGDLQVFETALFEESGDEELVSRRLRNFYIWDIEVCRKAGLAGFGKR